MNIKFANARQAKDLFTFKNLKQKLHGTTVAIWFNKACRIKHLTPTYISIKINGNTRQDKNTIQEHYTSHHTLPTQSRYKIPAYQDDETEGAIIHQAAGMRGPMAQWLAIHAQQYR
jgi:hypothetical protein